MTLRLKRVYEPPSAADGLRVLVDRLWPRGLARDKARVDCWLKDLAPSDGLRRWFGHDPAKWAEFKRRYFRELSARPQAIAELAALARRRRVTLLFAAAEPRYNNAVALKAFLARKLSRRLGRNRANTAQKPSARLRRRPAGAAAARPQSIPDRREKATPRRPVGVKPA